MTFLDDYDIYTDHNESPKVFHRFAGLNCLAIAGSRCYFMHGRNLIRPNMYTLFVGDAASGKSFAKDCAARLLLEVNVGAIIKGYQTPEALFAYLSDKAASVPCEPFGTIQQLTILSDELVTVLGKKPEDLISPFTDLWSSGAYEYHTKGKGVNHIVNPYLSIFACATPHTLKSDFKQLLNDGGFARRVFYVYANSREGCYPIPLFTNEQREAQKACVTFLQEIREWNRELKFSESGFKYYENWYTKIKAPMVTACRQSGLKSYLNAGDVLLIKLAMLLALNEKTPEITSQHLAKARGFLEQSVTAYTQVLANAGANNNASIAEQIYQYIVSYPAGVNKNAIIAQFYCQADVRNIEEALSVLKFGEKIIQVLSATKIIYKAITQPNQTAATDIVLTD